MFKLSTTLFGHEDDVKTLVSSSENIIVSGSRDTTVRVWYRHPDSKNFASSVINYKSPKFINSLALYDNGNEKYIVSGGNDNLINLTPRDAIFSTTEPEYCLVGHEANVCTLDSRGSMIMSGSWDSTAKIWNKKGEILFDLKGHENSVWSVKFLSDDTFLTCGADRTIRKWHKNKQISCFIAHEDVVRDLLILPNGDFASCSNDSTIKIWGGDSSQLKATLIGHQSFVYSLSLLPNGDIVSSGEDRSIRIWRNNKCIQVLTLPCISVWKVITLSNGDIVSASSDSLVRIFTKESSRVANDRELATFKMDLANSSISDSSFSNINKELLPNIESLKSNDPKTEGETKLIKSDANKIEMYQWTNKEWLKIGEVVGSTSSNQKKLYNGSYYDYVFEVDIEDGKPPLKLPLNITDNPYDVAEIFLANNDLPYSYLQQVVDFIMRNAEGVTLDLDAKSNKSGILPQKTYLAFDKFDEGKILNGFKKLNSKQKTSAQISEQEFEILVNCQDFDGLGKLAAKIIETWDVESKLIGFDILRSIISKIKPFENLFPIIRIGLEPSLDSSKIQMMTLRILCNTFTAKNWGEQIFFDPEILEIIFTDYLLENLKKDKKFLPITVATLLLNYSTLVYKFQLNAIFEKILKVIKSFLLNSIILEDEESSYRFIIAFGTLNSFKYVDDKSFILPIFEKYETERFNIIKKEICK